MNRSVLLTLPFLALACSREIPSAIGLSGSTVVATGAAHPFALIASGGDVTNEICVRSCISDFTPRRIQKVDALTVSAPCSLSRQVLAGGVLRFELSSSEAATCELSAVVTLDNGLQLSRTDALAFMRVESLDIRCTHGMCAGPFAWLEGAHARWSVEGRATDSAGALARVRVDDVAVRVEGEGVSADVADVPGRPIDVVSGASGTSSVQITAGGVHRAVRVRVASRDDVRSAHLVSAADFVGAAEVSESPFVDAPLPATVSTGTNVAIAVRAELVDGAVAVGDFNDVAVTPNEGLLIAELDSAGRLDALLPGRFLVVALVGAAEARWRVDIVDVAR